jgi:hypothetical protein
MGDLARASDWISSCERIACSTEEVDLHLSVREMQARIAVYVGAFSEANDILQVASHEVFASDPVGPRAHMLATYVSVQLHQQQRPITAALLDALVSTHQQRRYFTGHDRFVSVLWHALNRSGRGSYADACLSSYLAEARRERTPLPWYLRDVASTSLKRLSEDTEPAL